MEAHADTDVSALARALAERRWAPETRLRAAVDEVCRSSADLDPAQRARIEAAIEEAPDD